MKNVLALTAILGIALASVPAWQPQGSPTTERLRGVSAVNDRVAWASGNKGTVIRTIDGGTTWTSLPVAGADALDFRDIEAFSETTAYILSIGAGEKSRIYKTEDGGKSWIAQFTNPDPKAFYDAIAFWDATTGLAMGDPVDGRFAVLRTTDGGKTWQKVPSTNLPPALDGDGAFAASGTCLVVQGSRSAWFGSGGAARARVYRSTDQGQTWQVSDTPIAAGTSSAGIFSIAFADALHGVAVGGDYRKEQESSDNIARTDDGGVTWTLDGVCPLSRIQIGCRLRAWHQGPVSHRGGSRRHRLVNRWRQDLAQHRRPWVSRPQHRARRACGMGRRRERPHRAPHGPAVMAPVNRLARSCWAQGAVRCCAEIHPDIGTGVDTTRGNRGRAPRWGRLRACARTKDDVRTKDAPG